MMKKKIQIQSKSIVKKGIWISALISYGTLIILQAGCVRENTDMCEYTTRLYIVVETRIGNTNNIVNGATLFLFNDDRTYLSSVQVSAEQIAEQAAIPVSYRSNNIPWAVVWGNLGEGERVSTPVPGTSMDDMFVYMREGGDGYSAMVDNLFFGAKKLSGAAVEYIVISPKTGRITITVQGLPEDDNADEYYFTVDTPYDEYDFTGTPLPGEAALKFNGVFSEKGLITPEAYHMFHFPSSVENGEALTVKLYRTIAGSDEAQLIAMTDKALNGEPIVILRGMTTNVLIKILGTGALQVFVVVTDWDEIFQWDDW